MDENSVFMRCSVRNCYTGNFIWNKILEYATLRVRKQFLSQSLFTSTIVNNHFRKTICLNQIVEPKDSNLMFKKYKDNELLVQIGLL